MLYLGGQGYGFLIAFGMAVADPTAFWGLFLMVLSAGIAFAVSVRLTECSVLWGPFRFRPATSASLANHRRSSALQTAVMWTIFLLLIPLAIWLVEEVFKWDAFRFEFPIWLAIVAFLSWVGLRAMWVMTREGDGTPLPASCPRALVTAGPFAHIRNPMALGGIAQGFAVGLGAGSWLIMAYAFLGAVWWDLLARPSEEAYLASSFGEKYDHYKASVRCWIPKTRPYQD